jgi:hypothetical protein
MSGAIVANPDGSFPLFGKRIMPPQTSIHPRVRKGRTVYPKVNTAKAPKGKSK